MIKNEKSEIFIPPYSLKTAVLFLVFNRLDTTKQVFEAIRQAKPPRLYIAADGPRDSREGEAQKVQAVRDYAMSHIDWDCEIKTLFREKNLGCKYAVSGAIDWFFENEEMGIILEDDCLPSQSFFWFCEELLERYKFDLRVGQISGFNYGRKNWKLSYDYLFSRYPMIWGWASWHDRWKNFSVDFQDLEEIEKNKQFQILFGLLEAKERIDMFKKVRSLRIDTWDYPWSFSLYKNMQFTIIPKENFVINIGFDKSATHTSGKNPYKNVRLQEKKRKALSHPPYIVQDYLLYKEISKKQLLWQKLLKFLRNE